MILQFENVRVYQPSGSFASTLTLQNQKIIPYHPDPDQKICLEEHYLFPVFEDAHNHPSGMCQANYHLNLEKIASFSELQQTISSYLNQQQPTFFIGVRYSLSDPLNAKILDTFSHKIPIILVEISYHRAYLNSLAQDFLKVPAHLSGNRGNGILEERAWIEYAWPKLQTEPTFFQKSLLDFQKMLLSYGVGAVHDLFIGNLDHLRAYATLLAEQSWFIALEGYLSSSLLSEVSASDFPFLRGVKLFLDGSFGAKTACLKTPYLDAPNQKGTLWWTFGELQEKLYEVVSRGFHQVALHVIGDQTLKQTIQLLRWAKAEFRDELSFRLEHISLINETEIKTLMELEAFFCVQPNFIPEDAKLGHSLGNRLEHLIPLALYHKNGAKMGFGSDHLPSNPWYGIEAACHAPLASQKISRQEAFYYYTEGSASMVQNKERGALIPGKEANFWISKENPLLSNATPEKIYIKGRCVYP